MVEANSHILRSEMGGVAGLAGLFHRAIPSTRGAMDLEALREALSPALLRNRLATGLVIRRGIFDHDATDDLDGTKVVFPDFLLDLVK